MLNQPENKMLLHEITKNIYGRDIHQPYIEEKLCTHEDNIVQAWKTGVKPPSMKSTFWNSIKKRHKLVVFTIPLAEVKAKIESFLLEPNYVSVKKMGGDASKMVVIECHFDLSEKTGELHGQGKEMHQDLTKIKILIDITSIVEEIHAKNSFQVNYSKLGRITTICPS